MPSATKEAASAVGQKSFETVLARRKKSDVETATSDKSHLLCRLLIFIPYGHLRHR